MRWLLRLLFAAALLLLAAGGVAVAGALLSLDWDRKHEATTEALPLLSSPQADGVVRIHANGMTFRARVAGLSNEGPGVILLHGFPETSAMWTPLIEAAASAGFRVVAFDQRGYSPGARPDGVASYVVPDLVSDVLAVADSAGFERFHLVGHDWGCVVGWTVAIEHPARVLTWSGLSIPHPGTLLANLKRELPAYIRIFTAPFVPEIMLSFNGMAMLRRASSEGLTTEQLNEYLAVLSEPGALTGALNWYRALTTSVETAEVAGPVEVPTLFLYGTREGWVTRDALERQRELVAAPYTVLELDAGHWLIQDQPEAVVAAVLKQLERSPTIRRR